MPGAFWHKRFGERRLFERIDVKFPLKINSKDSAFDAETYLRDISAGGAKIITRQKLETDKEINCWVSVPDGCEPLHFYGRVAWLRNVGKDIWDAGICFKDIRLMDCHRLLKYNKVESAD